MEANKETGIAVMYDPMDKAQREAVEMIIDDVKARAKKFGEHVALMLAAGRSVVVEGFLQEAQESGDQLIVAIVGETIKRVAKRYGNKVRMSVDEKGRHFLYVARVDVPIAELFGLRLLTEQERKEAKKQG